MKRRKNPFPGVYSYFDHHNKLRHRFQRGSFSAYIHGEYGSEQFRREYQATCEGVRRPGTPRPNEFPKDTFHWLIIEYERSSHFLKLKPITQKNQRLEFEWIREQIGDLPFAKMKAIHVEKLMDKKSGAGTGIAKLKNDAANKVKKRLSTLFRFAEMLGVGRGNPASVVKKRKINPDGFHTWTKQEIERFREHWPSGSKPRLAFELALNTGAARQDLARLGWENVEGDRISYQRGKSGEGADLPITPELRAELEHVPTSRALFVTKESGEGYAVESLGNLFKDWARAAGVESGSIHGLRKALGNRLATAGATENEVAAWLAHGDTRQAATYTKKAEKPRLADSAFEKMEAKKLPKGRAHHG